MIELINEQRLHSTTYFNHPVITAIFSSLTTIKFLERRQKLGYLDALGEHSVTGSTKTTNDDSYSKTMPSVSFRWRILFQRHRIFWRPIFSTVDRDRRAVRVEQRTVIFEYLEQVNGNESLQRNK